MMKVTLVLVFALCQAAFISAKFTADDCSRDVQGDQSCRGHFNVYKYDVAKGACVHAIYGGCNPTQNNFATKAQCEKIAGAVCKPKSLELENFFTKDDCSKDVQEADCGVKIAVYKYDVLKERCVQAVFGGCQPTKNNFRTMADCKKYAEPVCQA